MSKKGLYLAVGFLWGALLGIGAGVAAAAMAAGAAWLFVFGDSAWPAWAGWAIAGIGVAVGLVTFATAMAVARMAANRQDETRSSEAGRKGGGAFAWALLLAGFAFAVGLAWQTYGRDRNFESAQEQTAAAEGFFSDQVSRAHRITQVTVDWPGGGEDGRAGVRLDGLREGDYRFEWQVRDMLYEEPLLRGTERLRLAAGNREIDVTLPADRIADGYRALLNRQDANVLVDEPFEFAVLLAPVLDEREASQMPPNEVRNLANGWSPLIRRAHAQFGVRFVLYGETLSWK